MFFISLFTFLHKTTVTDFSLAEGTLSAVICLCRVTVAFGDLLSKAWGHLLVRGGGWSCDGVLRFSPLCSLPVLRSRRSWHWLAPASIFPEISNMLPQVKYDHYYLCMSLNVIIIINESWKFEEEMVHYSCIINLAASSQSLEKKKTQILCLAKGGVFSGQI